MSVTVRLAGPDEWSVLRRLRLAALGNDPDAFGSTLAGERDQPEAWWRGRLEGPASTFLAHLDGRDVGLCVIAPWREHPEDAGLFAVWVAPEGRGQGVGDALVHAALTIAQQRGFARVILDVAHDNTHATALYERWGFQPTGRTGTLDAPRQHITEQQMAFELAAGPVPDAPR